MTTVELTAYRLQCDAPGCDEVTDPQLTAEDADENAPGWVLSEEEGQDMCPTHAKDAPC